MNVTGNFTVYVGAVSFIDLYLIRWLDIHTGKNIMGDNCEFVAMSILYKMLGTVWCGALFIIILFCAVEKHNLMVYIV